MPKYSTEPPQSRRPSDGGVSVMRLSPELVDSLPGGADASQYGPLNRVSFTVAGLDERSLNWLVEGQTVTFSSDGERMAVVVRRRRVGFVPRRVANRVSSVVSGDSYEAWISEVSHKRVQVTVEW